MTPGGQGPGDRRRVVPLLLVALERLYGALLVLYPRAFRRRYAEEMRRDFGELSREGLEEGGGKGLVGVWATAFSDLALTALGERSTMLARNFATNAYLPARPTVVARWGGLSALLGGVAGSAAYFFAGYVPLSLSFFAQLCCVLLCTLGLFGLYGTLASASGRAGHPGRLAVAGASLAGASVVSWAALGALRASAPVWGWTEGATNAAALCCWFAGLVLLGTSALGARLPGYLRALPLALAALCAASVVLSLVLSRIGHFPPLVGLPFLGTALLGLALLRGHDAAAEIAPSDAAGPPPRPKIGRGKTRPPASSAGAAKEKELLGALGRRGELTVAGAALETSLTVAEADWMLSALAAKGHLQVGVKHGRLLYSLWEGDAPK